MKTWLITGTSRGFGRVWAEAALARGDKVAATARTTDAISDLAKKYGDNVLPIKLDVTSKKEDDAAVKQAYDHFGRLDVVINNAGYGLFGTVEEVSEEQARRQIETNFFGSLWITKAVVPYMRQQKSGHIMQVSSIGGVYAYPTLGLYHASKWAVEGLLQALKAEVMGLGIKVTIIEPTGYNTDWGGSSSVHAEEIAAYKPLHEMLTKMAKTSGFQIGNPKDTGSVILKLADMSEPPLRIFLGKGPLELMRKEYADRIALWEKYNGLSLEAFGLNDDTLSR
jgi:NADP-dependent 3-hydroxy acid dehydrogenase YdfG